VPILFARRVVEPANQESASTATPEPIQTNNTDIIEIDESATTTILQLNHQTNKIKVLHNK